jgi:hypothetical protein
MGWIAYHKDGTITSEDKDGRPVQAGEEGNLLAIVQEDFNHRIFVDLINGVIIIDCDTITVQNGTFEIINPKAVLYICDETNIVGELFHLEKGEPDKDGWFEQAITPIKWRPIWFTRVTNGVPAKIIGAQATLPEEYGGHNVKKYVVLFNNGKVGIY